MIHDVLQSEGLPGSHLDKRDHSSTGEKVRLPSQSNQQLETAVYSTHAFNTANLASFSLFDVGFKVFQQALVSE